MGQLPENSIEAGRVLRFRTSAAIISRLGSQQLKDHHTAVIELVKNAYDADATFVTVDLKGFASDQVLTIQDDGSGMTVDDLQTKWGWLATENKVREDRSPLHRRRRLGQKGIGRFAAEKIGSHLELRTRTAGDRHVHRVRFDWSELVGDRELSEYEFPVVRTKPKAFEPPQGTRLQITHLNLRWKEKDIGKLRDQLSTLIDPEASGADFKILLNTPWEEFNGTLSNPLPGNETHRFELVLSGDGSEETTIWRDGEEKKERRDLDAPVFGPIRGVLRYFGRGLRKVDSARGGDPHGDWNMGVRVFRDGFRVRPYGEPGAEGDWLQIYRTRYRRGSRFRLKPHYLQGTIYISADGNPKLRDTSSREGLDNNDAFNALTEYVQEAIGVLSDAVREEELRQERQKMNERYKTALNPLTAGLNTCGSEEYRSAVDAEDREVRQGLTISPGPSLVRNAHWECLDCSDSWKAPRETTPTRCREFSVGRDGKATRKPGCGSANIRRKANVPRDDELPDADAPLMDDIMSGIPAYVSGIQLRPVIDWEMGENDEEAEVRPEQRQLAINGRHPAFLFADSLDGTQTVEGTDYEALRAVAGLTVHIIDAASQAWGRWHFQRHNEFAEYLTCYRDLKAACLNSLPSGTKTTT